MSGKRNKGSIFFVLAICAALGAAFTVVKANIAYNQLVPVVVANPNKGDIAPFTIVKAEDVVVSKAPRSEIQKGMYKDISGVVGKATRTIIPSGEKVSSKHLVTENASILSSKVNEKENGALRGFPIPVDMVSGLGGAIEAGDKVDVIGAMNLPSGPMKSNKEPIAKIIAQGAEILAKIGAKEQVTGYIVALTPKQAQDVQFALLNGKISFAIYPYEYDIKASETKPTTTESFMSEYIYMSNTNTSSNLTIEEVIGDEAENSNQ